MGYLQAQEFAEIGADLGVDLDIQLHWHLTANHYPPLPESWIEPAKRAIENAQAGEWDKPVPVSSWQAFPTSQLVEGLHLQPWIEQEAAYE